MKTLVCTLFFYAAAFGQMEPGFKKIRLDRDVSGILPKANGGTGVNSSHAFAQTGVDINTSFQVTALHLATPLGISQGGTGASSFPGVLLVPSADQTITGAHALLLSDPGASLGVGTSTPTSQLSITFPDASPLADAMEIHSGFGIGARIYTHADPGFRAPQITFLRSRGTQGSPAAVIAGTVLATIVGAGYDGHLSHDVPGYAQPGLIDLIAQEDFDPTHNGAYWSFQTIAPGQTTLQNTLDIAAHQVVAYQNLIWSSDNARDIGAAGTSRPRTGYFGTAVVAPVYQTTLSTPANSLASCVAGQMWADTEFVYVCTATSTIKRVALSSF